MRDLIKIIGKVQIKIKNNNIATSFYKNTNLLNKDNKQYIEILQTHTKMFKGWSFSISNEDAKWVDLIYTINGKKYLLDIKTQKDLDKWKNINLYSREFRNIKKDNRAYVVFNKNINNEIEWNIYYVSLVFMQKLKSNSIVSSFINILNSFETQDQNVIDLNDDFIEFRWNFDKKIIFIDTYRIEINFTDKKYYRNYWNSPFWENITLKIKL